MGEGCIHSEREVLIETRIPDQKLLSIEVHLQEGEGGDSPRGQ